MWLFNWILERHALACFVSEAGKGLGKVRGDPDAEVGALTVLSVFLQLPLLELAESVKKATCHVWL